MNEVSAANEFRDILLKVLDFARQHNGVDPGIYQFPLCLSVARKHLNSLLHIPVPVTVGGTSANIDTVRTCKDSNDDGKPQQAHIVLWCI